MEQSLPCVGSFSGNVEVPAELGGENDRMLSEALAVMNFHGFNKGAAVFNNFYYMLKANNCVYTKRRPIDIEVVVGGEGN